MRRIVLCALAVSVLTGSAVFAQRNDSDDDLFAQEVELSLWEVMEKYYEAVGGREAWKELSSLSLAGRIELGPGMQATFRVLSQRPSKLRVELNVADSTALHVVDGAEGWSYTPYLGASSVQPMTAEEIITFQEMANIEGPLIDYEAKGHELELLGQTDAQGVRAYKIRVSTPASGNRLYYIDAERFLPVLMEPEPDETALDEGDPEPQAIFSDYKDVDGLKVPHRVQRRTPGSADTQVIVLESVEFGTEFADSDFSRPGAVAAPVATEPAEPVAASGDGG